MAEFNIRISLKFGTKNTQIPKTGKGRRGATGKRQNAQTDDFATKTLSDRSKYLPDRAFEKI